MSLKVDVNTSKNIENENQECNIKLKDVKISEMSDQNLKKQWQKGNMDQKIGDCVGDVKREGTKEKVEEDRKEQNVRIVPIIMHDGKSVGDGNRGFHITFNEESSNTHFETETHSEIIEEFNEMEIESKLTETITETNKYHDDQIEKHDILDYMKEKINEEWKTKDIPKDVFSSKSSEPMKIISIQIENSDLNNCPANEEEKHDSSKTLNGEQKAYMRYKQVTPTLKSTKCIQKSKLEARAKPYDREHTTMLEDVNHANLSQREHSLQELNRDMQGIRKRLEDLEDTIDAVDPGLDRNYLTSHTYRTSTLPRRSKTPFSTSKSNISQSPQTTRKLFGKSLTRHSRPPVGNSSISLETLNTGFPPPAPHFGFFPKPETRPGAITPAYVTPRVYRSDRNLTSDRHSENNYEREDKNRSSSMSKSSFKSEPHTKSNTLPRQIKINQTPCSKEVPHDIKNRYSNNEDDRHKRRSVSEPLYEWDDFTKDIDGKVPGRMPDNIEKEERRSVKISTEKSPATEKTDMMDNKVKLKPDKYFKTSKTYQVQAVNGIARDKSKVDNLNPFLVEEDETENSDQETSNVNKLTSQTDQEDVGHANDAYTQTDKKIKKSGCKVM
eukprot:GFUD01008643.1.p1 GENE.GFUD01008643.1~~GFUD01008643.1.p1  ORF type:complete len:611 (+),score=177.19 GFUD01008643.1:49-1881(+)